MNYLIVISLTYCILFTIHTILFYRLQRKYYSSNAIDGNCYEKLDNDLSKICSEFDKRIIDLSDKYSNLDNSINNTVPISSPEEIISSGITKRKSKYNGRPSKINRDSINKISDLLKKRDTSISDISKSYKITPTTLYSYFYPNGELREKAKKIMGK